MDKRLRTVVSDLRKMESGEAAGSLLEHYPVGSANNGGPLAIISHLSWKRACQRRLADHYLSKLPFASARPYEVFASFMKVSLLIEIMRKYLLTRDRSQRLFVYHAAPVLMRAAKSSDDQNALESFLDEVAVE